MNTPPPSSSPLSAPPSASSASSSSESGIVVQHCGPRLAEAVTCRWCKEIYLFPKSFLCGHLACLRCIKLIVNNESNSVICPECNGKSDLGPNGAEGLPTVASIDKWSKIIRRTRESPTEGAIASSDPDSEHFTCYHILESSSETCSHCQKPYCKDCLPVHNDWVKYDYLADGIKLKERLLETCSFLKKNLPEIESAIHRRSADHRVLKAVCDHWKQQFIAAVDKKEQELETALDRLFVKELDEVKEYVESETKNTAIAAVKGGVRKLLDEPSFSFPNKDLTDTIRALKFVDENWVRKGEITKKKNFDNLQLSSAELQLSEDAISKLLDTITPDSLKLEEIPTSYAVIYLDPSRELVSVDIETGGPQIEYVPTNTARFESEFRHASIAAHRFAQEGNATELKNLFNGLSHWHHTSIELLVEHKDETDSNRTLLHQAAVVGNAEIARFLVQEMHARLDNKDDTEQRLLPVHIAACSGHLDVVAALLLNDDADPSHRAYNTSTLRHSIVHGHLPLVQLIIDRCPSLARMVDSKGRSMLHYAAESGHAAIVISLLGGNDIHVEQADMDGNTCLHLACKNGKLDVVSYLKDVRPSLLRIRNDNGQAPVDLARENGHEHVVSCLEAKRRRNAKKVVSP